jgi:uncharacterized membrane protein YhiD involved in acid resistance
MTTRNDGKGLSWRTAAIGGAIVAILLAIVGAGLLVAVLAGLAIIVIGLVLLPRVGNSVTEETRIVSAPPASAQPLVENVTEPVSAEVQETPEAQVTLETAQAPTQPKTAEHGPFASDLVKASKTLPGQQELAARKGTWRFENKPASA